MVTEQIWPRNKLEQMELFIITLLRSTVLWGNCSSRLVFNRSVLYTTLHSKNAPRINRRWSYWLQNYLCVTKGACSIWRLSALQTAEGWWCMGWETSVKSQLPFLKLLCGWRSGLQQCVLGSPFLITSVDTNSLSLQLMYSISWTDS